MTPRAILNPALGEALGMPKKVGHRQAHEINHLGLVLNERV